MQYEGEAHQPEGEALAYYQEVYFANWPDGPSRLSWPGITYFVVWPRWIRYSDLDQNPPFIEEFTFKTSRSATGPIPSDVRHS